MDTLLVFAGLGIGIVGHECGHAAMAAIFRYKVYAIEIGIGPVLARFLIGRQCWTTVRLLPVAGHVVAPREHGQSRFGLVLMLLGGVIANALIFVAAGVASAWFPQATDVLRPLGMSQLWLIVGNLIPFRVKHPVGAASDGLRLFRALFLPKADRSPEKRDFHTHLFQSVGMTCPIRRASIPGHCRDRLPC